MCAHVFDANKAWLSAFHVSVAHGLFPRGRSIRVCAWCVFSVFGRYGRFGVLRRRTLAWLCLAKAPHISAIGRI